MKKQTLHHKTKCLFFHISIYQHPTLNIPLFIGSFPFVFSTSSLALFNSYVLQNKIKTVRFSFFNSITIKQKIKNIQRQYR